MSYPYSVTTSLRMPTPQVHRLANPYGSGWLAFAVNNSGAAQVNNEGGQANPMPTTAAAAIVADELNELNNRCHQLEEKVGELEMLIEEQQNREEQRVRRYRRNRRKKWRRYASIYVSNYYYYGRYY